MKYYCDYCKSYLTHDTMSVRKSHLAGRNHIRFYCSYYELKAKETGDWQEEGNYEITLQELNNGPGNRTKGSTKLPPPVNVKGLPSPPPSVLNNAAYCKQAIYERMQASAGI